MMKPTVAILIAASIFAAQVTAKEYHIDRERERRAVFISDAPLEDIEGVTDKIDGYVLWQGHSDLASINATVQSEFYIEVRLADLDTKIGLRNRHMREDYLETDTYPVASFSGAMSALEGFDDSTFTIELTGKFSLHGIEQERSVTARAVSEDGGYRVTSEFWVRLEDHRIKVPKLMFLKVDQNILVSVRFHLKEVNPKE